MPRFTNVMKKDLLETLDKDIIEVEYVKGGGYLRLKLTYGETLILMEQDLVTLKNFLNKRHREDK